MYLLKLLLMHVIFCINESVEAKLKVVKYVYQRDMSEHCRRRVMPSVFLGNHVVEANSQILHFSQLEVPYSCFISIRTESGGNIILVIKMDDSLDCGKVKKNESPVKVFSMGETFGGYWGALPDSIISASTPQVEKFYTIKTTKKEVVDDEDSDSPDEISSDEVTIDHNGKLSEDSETTKTTGDIQDYIRKMIPIVNITGRLEKSDKEPARAFAEDDTFDTFYDVKREPGKKYESTLVPLMQFSMAGQASERRADGGPISGGRLNATSPEPRFDFEFDFGAMTLDPRLIFPISGGKPAKLGKRYPPLVNRRLNFKKNKGSFFSAKGDQIINKKHLVNNEFNESWSYIEGLLKNLSGNNLEQDEKENQFENKRFSDLLQRIADWQHNYSAYLAPNLTLNNPLFPENLQNTNLSVDNFKSSTSSSTTGYKHEILSRENFNKLDTKVTKVISTKTTPLNLENTESSRVVKVSAGTRMTPSTTINISTNTITKVTTTATTKATTKDTKKTTSKTTAKTNIKTTPVVTSNVTAKVTEVSKSTLQKINDFATGVTNQILELGSKMTAKVDSLKDAVSTATTGEVKVTATTNSKTKTSVWPTITSSLLTISPITGTMADHASWENVVQVAPKIAGILNTTIVVEKLRYPKSTAKRHKRRYRRRRRRKRSIQAIPIEVARPHNLTTDPDVITTPEAMYNFVDMQDFSHLVELQDDGIQGHLALRYMRRFVGATMFDVCTTQEHMTQYVLFFNTSRIVLALNNFSLNSMTVIATPARWLPFSGQRCNMNSLECQVAGKRVCVNKLTACDGVPNCGAMDIYDEDRLLCGMGDGQHNVYLAAFTFLAVLLTMLYTVHYWLKRCVPKVSEAFFIYTDGTENILYLDTIMRSPLDDTGKTYRGNFLEDILGMEQQSGSKKKGLLRKIFGFFYRKKKVLDDFELVDMDLFQGSHMGQTFSFAEMEIKNLVDTARNEAAVQTGSSLEMQHDNEKTIFFQSIDIRSHRQSIDPRAAFRDVRLNYGETDKCYRRSTESSELSMLKFLRKAKANAEQNSQYKQAPSVREEPDKEKELKITMYDPSSWTNKSAISPESSILRSLDSFKEVPQRLPSLLKSPLVAQDSLTVPGPSSMPAEASRRIRFNDALTSIPQEGEDDTAQQEGSQVLAQEEPVTEPAGFGGGRDFRRFWSKSKKDKGGKQKKHLPIH